MYPCAPSVARRLARLRLTGGYFNAPETDGFQVMELVGLEPATSWVRSVRDADSEGTKGMVQPFPRQLRAGISLLSHALLTTNSPHLQRSGRSMH
jgi:hypothetical protein